MTRCPVTHPEDAGHTIGMDLAHLPWLRHGMRQSPTLESAAGIGAATLVRERFLLCICAAQLAIRELLPVQRANRVLAGLQAALQQLAQSDEAAAQALRQLEAAREPYRLAALDDLDDTRRTPSGIGHIEYAFALRLIQLGEPSGERSRACLMLALDAPRHLWSAVQDAVVWQRLSDAGLLQAH
jgi:hypothetical protein